MSTTIKISHPSKIVKGTINLTGSKSISNRALIIQALCQDEFKIENLSNSADTQTLVKLLASNEKELNAGHAGTTYRFMTAYCAVSGRNTLLTGSERMRDRPIGELVDALNTLGANIAYVDKEGYPPLHISPAKVTGQKVNLKANISSQFITALLLIAPTLANGLEITLDSEPVSRPYIEMTLLMMEYFGVSHTWNGFVIKIESQKYIAKDYFVESDWSSASYLYSIAALANESDITINGLTNQQLQGDSAINEMMKSFGIESTFSERSIRITKKNVDSVPFYEYNYIAQPDIAQTMSIVGAAKGTSMLFSGLQTLAIKETDRTKALKNELQKFGVTFIKMPARFVQKTEVQYFMQEGTAIPNDEVKIETYDDHRMAMAFAPLSLLMPLIIKDKEVVGKSYPSYWEDLEQLGFVMETLDV